MTRSFLILVALAILTVTNSSALGQNRPQSFREQFRLFDRDGDGSLSAVEVAERPYLARWFDSIDEDENGLLSPEELRTYLVERRGVIQEPKAPEVVETEHSLEVDGRERLYIVQAPKESQGKLPVIFFFHGGGGRGARAMTGTFRDFVAQESFLAIYPQAWQSNWNDGRKARGIPEQVEGVDDVAFVRAIVEDLNKRYEIDRTQIFASGASNGGIFSHCLAAKAADLFAAIAPVIGGLAEPLAADFQPSHPISLLVIQGDDDALVPIDGGAILGRERRGRIIATEAMLQLYLEHNGISGEPEITMLPDRDPEDGTTTKVRRYPSGKGGTRVTYILVQGGGHTMPGRGRNSPEREQVVGKTSQDFNAPETILEFFWSCPPRIDVEPGKKATSP